MADRGSFDERAYDVLDGWLAAGATGECPPGAEPGLAEMARALMRAADHVEPGDEFAEDLSARIGAATIDVGRDGKATYRRYAAIVLIISAVALFALNRCAGWVPGVAPSPTSTPTAAPVTAAPESPTDLPSSVSPTRATATDTRRPALTAAATRPSTATRTSSPTPTASPSPAAPSEDSSTARAEPTSTARPSAPTGTPAPSPSPSLTPKATRTHMPEPSATASVTPEPDEPSATATHEEEPHETPPDEASETPDMEATERAIHATRTAKAREPTGTPSVYLINR